MAKKKGRRQRKKRVGHGVGSVLISEETWLLMQEVADLMGEIHRLTIKASECQERFKGTRRYKTLARALSSER